MPYVYLKSEPQLYTVGFYNPDGKWIAESDHDSSDEAARRVAYLNGDRQTRDEELNAAFIRYTLARVRFERQHTLQDE